jgi:hypothetical protein
VSGIKKFFVKDNYNTFHIQGIGDENGFIAHFPNTQIRDNFKALLKEGDVIGDNQLSFKIKEDKDLILNQPYCCTTVGYESFLKRKAFVLSLDQMPDCITRLIYDYIDEDFREIKIGCSDAKDDTTLGLSPLNKETLQTMVHTLPTFTESLPNPDKEMAMKHSATIHQATELYLNSDGQEKEKNKDVLVSVLGKAYNEPELEHNISWKVIIKNILLCLTGVGLFLLLGKIIYAAVKNNQVDMQSETNLMKNKTACTAQSRSAVKRKEKWYFFAEEPKPRIENNKIEMKSPQCGLG